MLSETELLWYRPFSSFCRFCTDVHGSSIWPLGPHKSGLSGFSGSCKTTHIGGKWSSRTKIPDRDWGRPHPSCLSSKATHLPDMSSYSLFCLWCFQSTSGRQGIQDSEGWFLRPAEVDEGFEVPEEVCGVPGDRRIDNISYFRESSCKVQCRRHSLWSDWWETEENFKQLNMSLFQKPFCVCSEDFMDVQLYRVGPSVLSQPLNPFLVILESPGFGIWQGVTALPPEWGWWLCQWHPWPQFWTMDPHPSGGCISDIYVKISNNSKATVMK